MFLLKILAVNGATRLEKSDTARVLTPFLEGMRDAGAFVELFYANRLHIEPCIGDFQCWEEKPGVCSIQNDDMQMLYPKLREADVLVGYASLCSAAWGDAEFPEQAYALDQSGLVLAWRPHSCAVS